MVISPARALRNSGIYRTPIPSPTCLTRLGNKTDGGTCNQNPRKPGEDMTVLLKKNLLIKDFVSLNTRTAKGHRFRTTSHKQARLNPSIQYYIYIFENLYIFNFLIFVLMWSASCMMSGLKARKNQGWLVKSSPLFAPPKDRNRTEYHVVLDLHIASIACLGGATYKSASRWLALSIRRYLSTQRRSMKTPVSASRNDQSQCCKETNCVEHSMAFWALRTNQVCTSVSFLDSNTFDAYKTQHNERKKS